MTWRDNENHKKAADYYNLPKGWVLHHKDETLRYTDPERYHEWRIEDVVPMSKSEHIRLHQKGKPKSEEHRKHMSEAKKGKPSINGGWAKGLTKDTDPRVARMGNRNGKHATTTGRKYYNNGQMNIMAFECPEGFVPGMLPKKRRK